MQESMVYENRGSHPPRQTLPMPREKKLACDNFLCGGTYRRRRILSKC